MKTIHPAIAGHAMEENEKLRGLLRELREITSEYAWDADLEARVDAALSQQAEPDHVEDMRAMVEPARAQDERWAVHAQGPDELYAAFSREDAEQHAAALNTLSMPAGIQVSAIVVESPWPAAEHWKYLAEQERDHVAELRARVTRPAQTEQPVQYTIGDLTYEKVFKAAGLTNLSDMQAVLDAVETAVAQTAQQDTVAVLEVWDAIGHDTGCNPSKDELLASLRNMAELATSEDALQPEQSGWIGVEDRLPEVAAGDEGEFIVCVYRSHNGESYSFSARFLNDYPLHTDYEDEPALHSGWYDVKEHADYDGWYSPLIDEKSGDKVTHWMPLPAAPAMASQGGE